MWTNNSPGWLSSERLAHAITCGELGEDVLGVARPDPERHRTTGTTQDESSALPRSAVPKASGDRHGDHRRRR
jgi:hypothetical protein